MRLDIVVPAHDEEHRIGRTLEAYRTACAHPDVRFLVALDHCRDGTADIVRAHAAADPRVELYEYPKLGKGGVLMETFRRCDGDLVAFVDADCATPPEELLRLAEVAQHADGAIASRRHPASLLPRRRALSRRMTSAGFAGLVHVLFRLPYADTQCGAKVLRREVLAAALPLLSSRDFVFDVDLLLVAGALGARIVEVPTVWVDQDGSRVHVTSETRRMATSLLRLWLHHHVLSLREAAATSAPLSLSLSGELDRVAA
jgi:glycosyltransferase involved in cell wall biosynthesis